MKKSIIVWVVLAIAGGIGVWYYLTQRQAAPPPAAVQAQPPAPAPAPAQPAILHPVPQAGEKTAQAAALPSLNDSDPAVRGALSDLIGAEAVKSFLAPDNLIRRIVATVDNLPRTKVPLEKRPVVAVAGQFRALGDEEHATLDPSNFARYAPMVEVIGKLDMQRVADLYFRLYPLFQSAYQDLGYPDGYFNDRLIAVIDVLLATPQPNGPIALVQPNVLYEFADPKLEALPAGQKLLIRMGPENETLIKSRLSELRAALTAAPPR